MQGTLHFLKLPVFCDQSALANLWCCGQDVIRDRRTPVGSAPPATAGLTKRELLIPTQISLNGASNRKISTELHVTQQTVKFHLTNIYRKLGVDKPHQRRHRDRFQLSASSAPGNSAANGPATEKAMPALTLPPDKLLVARSRNRNERIRREMTPTVSDLVVGASCSILCGRLGDDPPRWRERGEKR